MRGKKMYDEKETKSEKRSRKAEKARYGHTGLGSVHTRIASDAEVRGHIRKIKARNKGK
jgi:hypothetical protein